MGPDPTAVEFQNLFTELVGLTSEFGRQGLDYAVCDGLALAVHGFPRATKDIDFLGAEQSLPRIRAAARHCGFTIPGTAMTFRSGERMEQTIKPLPPGEDVLILDLLLVGEHNRDEWESRHEVETTGGTIWAAVEGLKSMKRRAVRVQDLADLQRLEEILDGRAHG